MGRAPCCDKASVKKGPWSPEEDATLKSYIEQNGTGGNWIALPQKIGLKRCGKSCRLRWLNYLRPNIRHGGFSEEEDRIILSLYISIGSRWSIIAAQLPGRTDNDIKNYWNTRLKKKLFGKQSRKNQRQQHFARQGANGGKEEASRDAAGTNGLVAGDYNWHQHAMAMAMPVRPMSGSMMEGNHIGEEVDESIRKLLFKLGGSPFMSLPPPPVYGETPSFVAPSVHTTPLSEGGIQLPALELDESFHFNQVKLDGLDCFFGMGDQNMRWNEHSWGMVEDESIGQPGACSSRLRRVRGRVRQLWVFCTQSFPAFLQEAVSRTRTRDLMVTRLQLYRCAKASLLKDESIE